MAGQAEPVFVLRSRRRISGAVLGTHVSARRGSGAEIATTRAYQRGDSVRAIDWAASARLSSARANDEFLVRDFFADEGVRAVVIFDRRPEMEPFPAPFPWLDKALTARRAAELIVRSTVAARGACGLLALDSSGSPRWTPPRRERARLERDLTVTDAPFGGPSDSLATALAHLLSRAELPPQTFVFVLSDFIAPVPAELWARLVQRRWDVVPVLVQDPTWERSFPHLGGLAVPVRDPHGKDGLLRLGRRDARSRRERNEDRYRTLLEGFHALELDTVELSNEAPGEILAAFERWSASRAIRRAARR